MVMIIFCFKKIFIISLWNYIPKIVPFDGVFREILVKIEIRHLFSTRPNRRNDRKIVILSTSGIYTQNISTSQRLILYRNIMHQRRICRHENREESASESNLVYEHLYQHSPLFSPSSASTSFDFLSGTQTREKISRISANSIMSSWRMPGRFVVTRKR